MTASLLLFRLASLREAASCAEYLVGLGKPADRKVIDAEGFDNSLLVAFTEDFGVDIQAAARRQIEHWMMCMADLKKKGTLFGVPLLYFPILFGLVFRGGSGRQVRVTRQQIQRPITASAFLRAVETLIATATTIRRPSAPRLRHRSSLVQHLRTGSQGFAPRREGAGHPSRG